jgi:hypothetical protein
VDSLVTSGLAGHFDRLTAEVEDEHEQRHVLEVLARTAAEHVPNCSWAAAVQVDRRGRPHIVAFHGPPGSAAAGLEAETGEGPALAAVAANEIVHAADLTGERRWPLFAERVTSETPVRAAVARCLTGGRGPTTLTLYAERPHAFDGAALHQAHAFLAHARSLVRYTAALDKIDNLSVALSTSRLIGTAVGVVMHTHRLTADEAFELLRRTSVAMQVKVRTIAEQVVETGLAPPAAGPDSGATAGPPVSGGARVGSGEQ